MPIDFIGWSSQFAIEVTCKQAMTTDNKIMTEEGTIVYVISSEFGNTTTPAESALLGDRLVTYGKFEDAQAAARTWVRTGGHPWYYVPKSARAVEVFPDRRTIDRWWLKEEK